MTMILAMTTMSVGIGPATVALLSVILVWVLALLAIVISVIIIARRAYDLGHLLLGSPGRDDGRHSVAIGRVLPGPGIARGAIDSTLLLILVRWLSVIWRQIRVWLLAVVWGQVWILLLAGCGLTVASSPIKRGRP